MQHAALLPGKLSRILLLPSPRTGSPIYTQTASPSSIRIPHDCTSAGLGIASYGTERDGRVAARLNLESEGALFRVSFLSSPPVSAPFMRPVPRVSQPLSEDSSTLLSSQALPAMLPKPSLWGPHVSWYRAYPDLYQPAFLPGYTTIYPISREPSCVAYLLGHGCIRVWIVIN